VAGDARRPLGTGAALASGSLALTFVLLGLNSIAVARIEGAEATGLLALSNQLVLVAIFLCGLGLRTGAASLVGAGQWSARAAVRSLLGASLGLGLAGAAVGVAAFGLERDGALSGFDSVGYLAVMASLPLALAWWTLPAVALALDRYEAYAALMLATPVATLMLSPAGALVAGAQGAVVGLAGGFATGGLAAMAWSLAFARSSSPGPGAEEGLGGAVRIGARAWVNDLFQLVTLRPDLFILNAYALTADVGVYSIAVTVTSVAWVLSQSLATVALPRSAALRWDAVEGGGALANPLAASTARHATLVSVSVSVAVGAGLFAVPLIWGPEFERSVELGLILLPGVAALGVGRVMVASFTGLGHASYALVVGLVSLPLTVVAYLVVVPDSGATGAAVVSVASYLLTSLVAVLLFARTTHLPLRDYLVPRRSDVGDYVRFARRLLGAGTA
jgi:O-antigen/teichoic acid export membrane protein